MSGRSSAITRRRSRTVSGSGIGRGVPAPRLCPQRPEPVGGASERVDSRPVHRLGRQPARLVEGRDRDVVPAGGQLGRQILDHALLAADDGRKRLGEHQDAHRRFLTVARIVAPPPACQNHPVSAPPDPGSSDRPTISVVICAFTEDRLEALGEAIGSIGAQSVQPLETVLVIDHAPELLVEAQAALAGDRGHRQRGGAGPLGRPQHRAGKEPWRCCRLHRRRRGGGARLARAPLRGLR